MGALLLLVLVAMPDEVHEVVTAHYQLKVEGSGEEAAEFGRVLEAAYPLFKKRFGGEPKLAKKEERLPVRFYLTREAWEAGLTADGATPPAAGGYYWPQNRTAYLFRQPSAYYTRTLLLHECGHQFHFLVRTRNTSPIVPWYTEGLAEYLAAHFWDGNHLELGVMPLLSLEDYAGNALRTATAEGFQLAAFVDGASGENRPLGWALVRYLDTVEPKKFDALARKLDGGNVGGPLFRKLIGEPKAVQPKFVEWLGKAQEPWSPVHVDWQAMSANRIKGKGTGTSVCRIKAPVTFLDATLELPSAKRWKGGVMLHYTGPEDWSVFLIDWAGFLDIKRWQKDHWKILEQGQGPGATGAGSYRLQVFRRGGEVSLSMGKGDVAYGPWELPGDSLGLALQDCEISFRELSWR